MPPKSYPASQQPEEPDTAGVHFDHSEAKVTNGTGPKFRINNEQQSFGVDARGQIINADGTPAPDHIRNRIINFVARMSRS